MTTSQEHMLVDEAPHGDAGSTAWRRRLGLWGVVLPLTAFAVLQAAPALNPEWPTPYYHFLIVSGVSLLVAISATVVALAGRGLRNLQVTLFALAFTSLAGFFAVHGLTTPGFVLGANNVVSISTYLSVVTAAAFLALASLPTDSPWAKAAARWHTPLIAVWVLVILGYAATALFAPRAFDNVMISSPPLNISLGAVTVALSATALVHFARSYRYSRLPLQSALAYAAAWIGCAQIIMVFGPLWHVSWWLYHLLLLLAAGGLLWGMTREYSSGPSLIAAVRRLWLPETNSSLGYFNYSEGVGGLVEAVEIRDPYTAGHSRRVARTAVEMGHLMGLPPERLRALAQGAILHDIGKLGIPDTVLNKPGALTEEERRRMEHHTVHGYNIARRMGTLSDELDIIRCHHERWDGSGYPEGRSAEDIPLLARIVAVADVHDALTSDRAYREAWAEERARQLIRDEAGSHFDPDCVAAWERVLEANGGELPSEDASALL